MGKSPGNSPDNRDMRARTLTDFRRRARHLERKIRTLKAQGKHSGWLARELESLLRAIEELDINRRIQRSIPALSDLARSLMPVEWTIKFDSAPPDRFTADIIGTSAGKIKIDNIREYEEDTDDFDDIDWWHER